VDTLRALTRFTLERFYPQFVQGNALDIVGFFSEVARRTAVMVTDWMRVGFVHGVMNTDNMSILGLTIDYGPFGWLEGVDPRWTPNTTDAGGRRYRYGQQPRVAHWNLLQLANALVPLGPDVRALEAALDAVGETLETLQRAMFLRKLGLTVSASTTEDDELIGSLFGVLTATETDMTLFFRRLAELPHGDAQLSTDELFATLRDAYYEGESAPREVLAGMRDWVSIYRERARSEGVTDEERVQRMNACNPLYVPRNYILHETIEKVRTGDHDALARLLDVLRRPYEAREGLEAFAAKRPEWARNAPGCDMLSCSS
jgi:uncharacterized protein YdiU (UPF0061 family)